MSKEPCNSESSSAASAASKELLSIKIEALEKITEQKFRTSDLALVLQAKETERRLEKLNGKSELLERMQSSYLLREVYDANMREVRQGNSQGRLAIISAGMSFVVSFVLLAVAHALHF